MQQDDAGLDMKSTEYKLSAQPLYEHILKQSHCQLDVDDLMSSMRIWKCIFLPLQFMADVVPFM
jgi:hypothetical protein